LIKAREPPRRQAAKEKINAILRPILTWRPGGMAAFSSRRDFLNSLLDRVAFLSF
jgi:hypothetical protein